MTRQEFPVKGIFSSLDETFEACLSSLTIEKVFIDCDSASGETAEKKVETILGELMLKKLC